LGIIQKQSVTGSVISYLGVLIGFLTTGLLLPNLLSLSENGIIKLLVANAALFGQLGTLGFTGVTTRMFTYFRDKQQSHHGFMRIGVLVSLAGFALSVIIFYLIRNWVLLGKDEAEAVMIAQYIDFVIPMILANIFFNLFDNFYKVLFDAVKGALYREVYQRIFTLAAILWYYYGNISFNWFIWLYVAGYALPSLMLMFSLIKDNEFSLKADPGFLTPGLRKSLVSVGFFSIVVGFSNIAILNIDSVMVNNYVGLSETGIYGITFFFGTLVIVPSRIIQKISSAFLADSWKEGNTKQIRDIYYKTSINQFILGALIVIGIWGNIDNIFKILPAEYEAGKYVILLISLTNLLEMAGGASAVIISVSPKYIALSIMMVVLLVLIVVSNMIFIPLWGISGAAFASLISYFVYVLMRFWYLYYHYRLQPFQVNHLKVIVIAISSWLLQLLIPAFNNFIIDILIRSTAMVIVYTGLSVALRVSEEVEANSKLIIRYLFKR